MTTGEIETTSTRPYLIRALHEWCTDNGLTPHLAVSVDGSVQVPPEFVNQGEIVLNISFDATNALKLGDDLIEFKGRFGGAPREIRVPVRQVMAIYARENGQGMSFPISVGGVNESTAMSSGNPGDMEARKQLVKKGAGILAAVVPVTDQDADSSLDSKDAPQTRGPRPTLTRIK
jgi:stringent starvation protein B